MNYHNLFWALYDFNALAIFIFGYGVCDTDREIFGIFIVSVFWPFATAIFAIYTVITKWKRDLQFKAWLKEQNERLDKVRK